ncbi:MAG: hypothetical protein R2832_15045 [Rhodothermales bacterium]
MLIPCCQKRLTVDSQERRWTSVLPDGAFNPRRRPRHHWLKAAGALEAFLEANRR